ncbi:MAG: hypothetical protein L7F78_27025, partial [Syntrophales bacterium LBB04]|nr:hypothetical protein [Syntrophales bacterium LBB04]
MIINKILRFACLTFLFLTLFPISAAHSQGLKKISVLPFEVYSKSDSAAIKESLYKNLSGELAKEKLIRVISADAFLKSNVKIDKRRAMEIGKSLGADFVIMGSLTKLGETLSIDARIIDVTTANTLPSISVQDKGLVNLGIIVAKLRTEILIHTGLVQKIAKIEIKGNRKIEASAITAQIKSKVGNSFFKADIT